MLLLERHGTAKCPRTMANMTVIRKTCKHAVTDGNCVGVLDYTDCMPKARFQLNGMSDEVFMLHLAQGLAASEVAGHVKQAMNTSRV